MKFHTLRLWPNGEVGMGWVRRFTPPPVSSPDQAEIGNTYSWTKSELLSVLDAIAVYGSLERALSNLCPGFYEATLEEVASLGLSNVPNSHSRSQRGMGGLSGHGKRMVRNGCYLLEQWVGSRNVAMITCTIPAMPDDVYRAVVDEWSEICRIFTQRLHRRLKAVGNCPWVIGVCEIQEKRRARDGGLPLHLHLVVEAKNRKVYNFSVHDIRAFWQQAISSRVPYCSDVSFDSSTRIERVKKSVSSYLCKYFSKGNKSQLETIRSQGWTVPTSWWYGVGKFKAYIKRLMVYETGTVATMLFDNAMGKGYGFRWCQRIYVQSGEAEICVGIAGKISRELQHLVRNRDEEGIERFFAAASVKAG